MQREKVNLGILKLDVVTLQLLGVANYERKIRKEGTIERLR